MKTILRAAALTGVSFTSSAFAYSHKDEAKSAPTSPAELTPIVVVKPTDLPLGFTGATVNVEFSLDQAGRPQAVRLPSVYDPQLKRQLEKAISQWQFAPRSSDAAALGKRFVVLLEVKPSV